MKIKKKGGLKVKPAANHPWRVPLKVGDWAREQSSIRNVTSVIAARPNTLSRKNNKLPINDKY